ncbi:MAG: RHS repeat protein, partial [Bacteroidales bacterium]|nr:RHS repeat protein [Bacteroidales bacterium]
MKRLIMVAAVLIMIAMTLPLNAQNSIYPSSLTWLAGETDTKEVQIITTGHWSCDSTLYSNHFSVTPQSGNGSGYLYVTPLSVNSGEEAIEGVAELSVNGTPLLLNMLHSAPTPPVPTLDVSPSALSWTFDGTEQQTIYVTAVSGTWDYSLSGSGFSCTRSGSTLLVQPTCWDHGDSPHTAAIAFSSGGATSNVSLVQAANPYVSGVTDTNYIQKTTFTNAGGISSYRDVTYFDGLGYEVQGIAVGGSPSGKSVVNQTVYDAMRRPDAMLYLPYSRGDAGASLISESASLSSQLAFYGNHCGDVHPWSQKEYGSSSAGRVKSVRREGDAWSAAEGRKMTLSYLGNTSADAVMKFSFMPAQGDGCAVAVYAPSDQYGDGALRKMRSRDEEGAVSETFTDGAGRTVCVRSWSGTDGTGTASDTYYVYDLWDRLVLVIQPEGTALLLGKPASQRNIPLFGGEGSMNADIFDEWCFAWRYDGTGNLVVEHTPGGGTALYAYDARDRQVLRTDARMRPDGDTGPRRMVFTQYDQYDRIVEERYVSSPQTYWETLSCMIRDTVSHTMSSAFIESYLPTLQTLRSAEYFPFGSVTYATTGDGAFVPETGIAEAADLETVRIKGLLKNETLYPAPAVDGTVPAGAPSVTRYYHYDYLGRVIQSKEVWSDGRTRRVSTKYSFTGDILATKETVSVTVEGTGELESSLATFYTRDPRGRVLSCSRILNDVDTLATVHYAYDDLGRLIRKTVGDGTSPVLKTQLAYDLHGWTTGIDVSMTDEVGSGMDTVFSETLRYATAEKDNNAKRYDGNISETAFSHRIVPSSGSPYLQSNTWSYAYDGLKRLTDANHYPGAALTPSLTDTEREIAYDRNGNITALKRYGNSGMENNLSFTHDGNRMTSLSDAHATGTEAGDKSFTYDANGNLTYDGRKDLDLSWNLLNLVDSAAMHGSSLKYAWLSDGTKVSVKAHD